MASLRDQLLKTGLVDEKRAKQAEKEKRDAARQAAKHTPKKAAAAEDPAAAAAREAQAARAARDRELNRQKIEAAEKRALREQIRQLVVSNRIEKNGGERGKDTVSYRFTDGTRIEKVYVTETLQRQLARGQLGIVRYGNGYEVVPADVAEKIRARDPGTLVVLAAPAATPADGDDPYAQFQIPDDLTW